ncbi:MAG: Nif3-like dinuclear metal center hexameric protein [Clostridia bacterium]|nr:Nif3-like dinuclear metal center hexameric protein [Clostridia bacterium]
MPVKVRDIADILNEIAPPVLAEEWDNVGLLVGHADKEVRKILCALDLTEAVVAEAVELKVDMIVTHHPSMFRGVKRLTDANAEGRMLLNLIEHGIAHYAAHTNFDKATPGVNDALCKALGLTDVVAFESGLRLGRVETQTFGVFAALAAKVLGGQGFRYGDDLSVIQKVAVMGGSGGDYVGEAKSNGADVFLSGEFSYHLAVDCAENGLNMLAMGHDRTEIPGARALADMLRQKTDAEVIDSSTILV